MASFSEVMEEVSQSIGARRVFGEPYEKNGVTVIPAARVTGGAGGGEGEMPATADESTGEPLQRRSMGSGGGFGLSARPAGAYVIKGETVRWLPALDVNRLLFGFQVVLIVFFIAFRSIANARAKSAPDK